MVETSLNAVGLEHAPVSLRLSQMFKAHGIHPNQNEDMTSFRPDGYTTLTPMIVVTDAAAAIDFYAAVFGARTVTRMVGPDGKVWHCELELQSGRFQLMDANPAFHMVALDRGNDDVPFSLAVYVPDCDVTTAQAAERGATIREQPGDFDVTGDRFSSIRDPFGIRWTIMTRTTPRTDAEIQSGLDAWAGSLQQ